MSTVLTVNRYREVQPSYGPEHPRQVVINYIRNLDEYQLICKEDNKSHSPLPSLYLFSCKVPSFPRDNRM